MIDKFESKENFIEYYIKNFNTWTFNKQSNFCSSKLNKLKTKQWRDDYTFLLFSNYLQLLENFLIFLLVFFHKDWIDNIFENNRKQKNNLFELLDLEDNNWKTKYWIRFDIFIKQIIRDYIWLNEDEYFKYIREAIKDYFAHKDLLNSYKHWFRLNSRWKISNSFNLNNKSFLVSSFDSSLLYYTKKWNIIFENNYSFNYEYIKLKTDFIINLIDNLKLHRLNIWKSFIRETIYICDKTIKTKSSNSITKTQIFKIKKDL